MRVRKTIRTVLIVLAAIVVLAGLRYVEVFIWPGLGPNGTITVSRETTYFTGPLNDDGTVNYVAAVNQRYGKGVTPENNAAVLIVRAVGPWPMTNAQQREFLSHLGISSLAKRGDYFVGLEDYVVESVLNDEEKDRHADAGRNPPWGRGRLRAGGGIGPMARGLRGPDPVKKFSDRFEQVKGQLWAANDYPVLADWLKANEKPFSLLVAASRRSRYFLPLVSSSWPPDYLNTDVSGPGLSRLQSMSEALAARAMLRAGRKDFEGAHSDFMTLHRLGRLLLTGAWLRETNMGGPMTAQGQDGHLALARGGLLTVGQARRVVTDLDHLPPIPDIVDAFDVGWRLAHLSLVTLGARATDRSGNERLSIVSREKTDWDAGVDWDPILRRGNLWHDRWVDALRKRTFAESSAALYVLQQERSDAYQRVIKQMREGGDSLGVRMFFAGRHARRRLLTEIVETRLFMMIPTLYGVIVERSYNRAMRSDVVTVAMALTAYRIERGEYPAKLSALSPDYLAEIPLDRFVDRPLLYRREGGGCVVYSVGENMTDDGGRKNYESWDDVVIRLGPDAAVAMPSGGE